MAKANFTAGMSKLHDAKKQLEHVWGETAEHWDDATRRNFEENHLRPLLQQLGEALEATNRLSRVLLQAGRECEDSN